MGVTRQSLDFLEGWLKPEYNSICELGDQQFMLCFPFQELSYTRTYWKNKGWRYVSIDINGYGESLMLNMNEDINIEEQFDVITDFGTSEHIADFFMAFKNTDKLCKVGGRMIHILPADNHWPNHGSWRARRPFFIKLGLAQEYIIHDVHEDPTKIGGKDSDQIYVVYEKTKEKEFISREEFDSFGPILKYPIEIYEKGKLGGGRTS